MEIEDQVIAITGASAGIGVATARLLAARGARVVLGARREEALARVVDEIESGGGRATARAVDVTRPEDVRRLIELAVEQYGRLDALVANAGVAVVAPLTEGTLADWNRMVDVNLRGVLHGIAAALPVFSAQGSGHFVTVTSTAAAKWVAGQGVYAATKAGVRALCEVLRQEVGPEIRATMVCPGRPTLSSRPTRSCANGCQRSRWRPPPSRRRSPTPWFSPRASTWARSWCAPPPSPSPSKSTRRCLGSSPPEADLAAAATSFALDHRSETFVAGAVSTAPAPGSQDHRGCPTNYVGVSDHPPHRGLRRQSRGELRVSHGGA